MARVKGSFSRRCFGDREKRLTASSNSASTSGRVSMDGLAWALFLGSETTSRRLDIPRHTVLRKKVGRNEKKKGLANSLLGNTCRPVDSYNLCKLYVRLNAENWTLNVRRIALPLHGIRRFARTFRNRHRVRASVGSPVAPLFSLK